MSETKTVRELRIDWMYAMGYTPNEVAEDIRDDPPTSIAEERAQCDAMARIQERNARREDDGQ